MIPGQSVAPGARGQAERFSAALSVPGGLASAAVAPQPNHQDRHRPADRQATLLVCASCSWAARSEGSPHPPTLPAGAGSPHAPVSSAQG
jgi:hypothetical protein